MIFFTMTAVAIIILCLGFLMLTTAKIPEPMSFGRQKLTRILLFGILWTTVIALTSHASHTLRSFSDGSHNLLNFRVYPTIPLTYFYSWRDNFDFWSSPIVKSYYTFPASLPEAIRTAYVLSLSLAVIMSAMILFTSYNRGGKIAALVSILVAFASLPLTLTYMLFPQAAHLNMSDNPVVLWAYFLEQFVSYLVIMILTGLELRSMKTFSQIKHDKASADSRQ